MRDNFISWKIMADVNEIWKHIIVPLQHMGFCKENHAIDQGPDKEISTRSDNEMKYREEIDNAYNELVHWKKNLFDIPKQAPGKAFINELTKLINKLYLKSPNRDRYLSWIFDG